MHQLRDRSGRTPPPPIHAKFQSIMIVYKICFAWGEHWSVIVIRLVRKYMTLHAL